MLRVANSGAERRSRRQPLRPGSVKQKGGQFGWAIFVAFVCFCPRMKVCNPPPGCCSTSLKWSALAESQGSSLRAQQTVEQKVAKVTKIES